MILPSNITPGRTGGKRKCSPFGVSISVLEAVLSELGHCTSPWSYRYGVLQRNRAGGLRPPPVPADLCNYMENWMVGFGSRRAPASAEARKGIGLDHAGSWLDNRSGLRYHRRNGGGLVCGVRGKRIESTVPIWRRAPRTTHYPRTTSNETTGAQGCTGFGRFGALGNGEDNSARPAESFRTHRLRNARRVAAALFPRPAAATCSEETLKMPAIDQKTARSTWTHAALYTTLLLPLCMGAAHAQDQGAAAIQKKLEAVYQLTKTTADKTDIVTAGSVVVLQKDNVLMLASTSSNPCKNTYKDGKVTQSGPCRTNEKLKKVSRWTSMLPGAGSVPDSPASRTFVTGEKFWVTKIEVRDSGKEPGIVLGFFTDAIN